VSRATRARIEVRIKRQAKVLENTTIERRRINDDTLPVTRQIADQSRLNRVA
jgi:hypothetical protein